MLLEKIIERRVITHKEFSYRSGVEINLEEYLSSQEYMNLHFSTEDFDQSWNEVYWQIKDSPHLIQDASGCFWNASKKEMLFPSKENGDALSFKTVHTTSCNNKIELDVSIHLAIDSWTQEIEMIALPKDYKILTNSNIEEVMENAGYSDENDFISEIVSNFCAYDLEFKCTTQGFTNIKLLSEQVEPDIVLFKHSNKLLDERKLSRDCWFTTYHIPPLQNDDEEPGIELYQEDGMPYLWWVTEILPPKDGCTAFRDVYGNCFYVGEEKNIGVCHIHNGVDVSDNPVIIEIDWDGYFKIKIVD